METGGTRTNYATAFKFQVSDGIKNSVQSGEKKKLIDHLYLEKKNRLSRFHFLHDETKKKNYGELFEQHVSCCHVGQQGSSGANVGFMATPFMTPALYYYYIIIYDYYYYIIYDDPASFSLSSSSFFRAIHFAPVPSSSFPPFFSFHVMEHFSFLLF